MELVESGMLSRMSRRPGLSMMGPVMGSVMRMESEKRSRMESEMAMVLGMVTWM